MSAFTEKADISVCIVGGEFRPLRKLIYFELNFSVSRSLSKCHDNETPRLLNTEGTAKLQMLLSK